MNVVDSSCWLEYFANGSNAAHFADAIEDTDHLIVPTIVVYEVFKRILQQRGEDIALQAVGVIMQGTIVEIDASLALTAARLSVEHRLPMADSMILATARMHHATLWTQDEHFKNIADVRYTSK